VLEIPSRLTELFHKLLFDFDYFMYAMLNGGLFGLIATPLIILMLWSLFSDLKQNEDEEGYHE
jgi:hypothetical protein